MSTVWCWDVPCSPLLSKTHCPDYRGGRAGRQKEPCVLNWLQVQSSLCWSPRLCIQLLRGQMLSCGRYPIPGRGKALVGLPDTKGSWTIFLSSRPSLPAPRSLLSVGFHSLSFLPNLPKQSGGRVGICQFKQDQYCHLLGGPVPSLILQIFVFLLAQL